MSDHAQLPLPIPQAPDQRFDTYIDAPDGMLAWLAALIAGNDPAGCGYLLGPAGSGKTHLLLGACTHAREAGIAAAYLPLARLGERGADALAAMPSDGLLAIDDIDVATGVPALERALFDAHNRAREHGARLLYAASDAPAQLALQLPDLRSRLNQCTRVRLPGLDDAGRAALLRQRAARRGLQLDEAAIDWLLRRVGRDLAGLAALLDRLDAASLAAQRRVTVPFLRQVLESGPHKIPQE